jgi:hypothetical protein
MAEQRFFIDHGTIHDRVTGKHVRTDPDYGPGRTFEEDGIEQCCALLNSLVDAHEDAVRVACAYSNDAERELRAAGHL